MKLRKTEHKILKVSDFFEKKYREKRYYDFYLVAVILLMVGLGLIMLYSTSSYVARMNFNDDFYYLKKQCLRSAIFLMIAAGISFMDYHIIEKCAPFVWLASMVLLILARTPLGYENDGKRWLKLGESMISPAECAKIAVILGITFLILYLEEEIRSRKGYLILTGFGVFQAMFVYIMTNDLSSAVIILGITAGMIFIVHPDIRFFLGIVAGLLVFVGTFIACAINLASRFENPRFQKIMVWLEPGSYGKGEGAHILRSLGGLTSGGIFGRGLGKSLQTEFYPEKLGNVMFSVVYEELGLLGGIIILILCIYLLYRLFFVARNAPDGFGAVLAGGIFIHFAIQILGNMAVSLNLIPEIGACIPFISYTGSSIDTFLLEAGIVLSVARKMRFREPELLL